MMPEAFSRTLAVTEASTACDALARLTGLPKARVKDCMAKGGVWWQRPGRKASRLRRATAEVKPGDNLEMNYDPALLALVPAEPELVFNGGRWSVWNKPAGVLSQGTRFADHCALPRLAQAALGARNELHPVHRLDREARGLILLAHDAAAAVDDCAGRRRLCPCPYSDDRSDGGNGCGFLLLYFPELSGHEDLGKF